MENYSKELYNEFINMFEVNIFEYDVENCDDLKEFLEFILRKLRL